MFIYSVSYSSYEDSSVIYLSHEKEFTEEEFEKYVVEAITWYMHALKSNTTKLRDELINGPISHSPANLGRLFSSRANREWPCISNIADLFPDIGYVMECPEYGFKVINPTQAVNFSGWQDPFCYDTDWVGDRDCATTRLSECLWVNGFTEKDSPNYESKKETEEHKNKHDIVGFVCPTCGGQTRDNPMGFGDGCWWCPRCGNGCGCTYNEDDPYDGDEADREDFYGLY